MESESDREREIKKYENVIEWTIEKIEEWTERKKERKNQNADNNGNEVIIMMRWFIWYYQDDEKWEFYLLQCNSSEMK